MAIGDLHDEQEHGERIRSWLRKNGVGLLCGVLLGFVFIAAWQWREASRSTNSPLLRSSSPFSVNCSRLKSWVMLPGAG